MLQNSTNLALNYIPLHLAFAFQSLPPSARPAVPNSVPQTRFQIYTSLSTLPDPLNISHVPEPKVQSSPDKSSHAPS
jgi:hypothetical protein